MNPRSAFFLPLAGLLAVPFSASAAWTEMTEAELSTVSGQAYVVTFGRLEAPIADLTERNLALGPIDVSGKARDIESDYPTSPASLGRPWSPPRTPRWRQARRR